MDIYIMIDEDWNVYTDLKVKIKASTGKHGYKYITSVNSTNHYFYYIAGKWYRRHKIPDKVLSFLFLSHPDLYAQVAKAFDL